MSRESTTTNVLPLRPSFDLRRLVRERLTEAVEGIFEEELSAVLGAISGERSREEIRPARLRTNTNVMAYVVPLPPANHPQARVLLRFR